MTTFKKLCLNRAGLAAGTAMGCLLIGNSQVHASGQYVVQDAETVDIRSCEIELWHNNVDDANFVNTICRFGDAPAQINLEVEMPRTADREVLALEGKYLFRELHTDGYGLGLFLSLVYDTDSRNIEERALWGMYTVDAIPDRMQLHFNLGATHTRVESETDVFWGGHMALALLGPFEAVAEVFGDDDDVTTQTGLRMMLLDDQLSVDVSYLKEHQTDGASGFAAGIAFQAFTF